MATHQPVNSDLAEEYRKHRIVPELFPHNDIQAILGNQGNLEPEEQETSMNTGNEHHYGLDPAEKKQWGYRLNEIFLSSWTSQILWLSAPDDSNATLDLLSFSSALVANVAMGYNSGDLAITTLCWFGRQPGYGDLGPQVMIQCLIAELIQFLASGGTERDSELRQIVAQNTSRGQELVTLDDELELLERLLRLMRRDEVVLFILEFPSGDRYQEALTEVIETMMDWILNNDNHRNEERNLDDGPALIKVLVTGTNPDSLREEDGEGLTDEEICSVENSEVAREFVINRLRVEITTALDELKMTPREDRGT
ncbi:hypothetical protein QBC39DRAFT_175199 [Podospora conica]|nr:hypothetical protein QBC39DRAFT_175199 [Schizothecium conicum]